MAKQGNIEELRHRADAGAPRPAWQLAGLLAEQGRLNELQRRADADDDSAAEWLTNLLPRDGRLDELWDEIDARYPLRRRAPHRPSGLKRRDRTG